MYDDFEDEDEEYPDFDESMDMRQNKTAKLILVMQMFAKNIGNVETAVTELYDLIQTEDEALAAINSLIGLAEELGIAMEEVDAAILGLIGYHEPLPEGDVEDFEASVLRDLAELDKMSSEVLFAARKQHVKDELNRRGFGL